MNMRSDSVRVVGAIAFGLLIGYIGMSFFGYLVTLPFPSWALRSPWLVPLLRVIAWVPLSLVAAYTLCKFLKGLVFLFSLLVGIAGLTTLVVQSSEYIYSSGFASVLQSLWPEGLFLLVVLPAATVMTSMALNQTRAARI